MAMAHVKICFSSGFDPHAAQLGGHIATSALAVVGEKKEGNLLGDQLINKLTRAPAAVRDHGRSHHPCRSDIHASSFYPFHANRSGAFPFRPPLVLKNRSSPQHAKQMFGGCQQRMKTGSQSSLHFLFARYEARKAIKSRRKTAQHFVVFRFMQNTAPRALSSACSLVFRDVSSAAQGTARLLAAAPVKKRKIPLVFATIARDYRARAHQQTDVLWRIDRARRARLCEPRKVRKLRSCARFRLARGRTADRSVFAVAIREGAQKGSLRRQNQPDFARKTRQNGEVSAA